MEGKKNEERKERRKERKKERKRSEREENPSLKNDVHLRGSGRQMFFFVNVQIVLNSFILTFFSFVSFSSARKKKKGKRRKKEGKKKRGKSERRKLFTTTPPLDQESNQ